MEIEGTRNCCGPCNKYTGTRSVNLLAHLMSTDTMTEFDDSDGGSNETSSGLSGLMTLTDTVIYRECPELEGSRSGLSDKTSSDSLISSFGPEQYVESFSDEVAVSSGNEFFELTSEVAITLSDSLNEDSTPRFILQVQDPDSHERALFAGSYITIYDFDVGLTLFCQGHKLTYLCQNDLLRLISVSFPTPNHVPRSSYMLLKQLVDFQHECTVHLFCGSCLQSLLQSSPCSNPECSMKSEPNAIFIHFHLQLN